MLKRPLATSLSALLVAGATAPTYAVNLKKRIKPGRARPFTSNMFVVQTKMRRRRKLGALFL